MNTNLDMNIALANEKYRRLMDYICQAKNGNEVDFDKVLTLVKSIHNDEIALIVALDNREKEEKPEKGIDIPRFMFQ